MMICVKNLERLWTKPDMKSFEVLSSQLFGRIEGHHEEGQSGELVSQPR
jgi:hypothetical protein